MTNDEKNFWLRQDVAKVLCEHYQLPSSMSSVSGPKRFMVHCKCGWVSEDYAVVAAARLACDEHIAEQLIAAVLRRLAKACDVDLHD